MDAIETKLLEALCKAAIAEKVADRALAIAQDCLVKIEILRNTPRIEPAPQVDPFAGISDQRPYAVPEEPITTATPMAGLSPFTTSFAIRTRQTVSQPSDNLDSALEVEEEV